MGPPPDPEQMASMLEDPNFASQLNEALSNPDVVDQMIRMNPMMQGQGGQQARQMLQDPNFRRMMTDPSMLRNMSQMRRRMPGMFGGGTDDSPGAFPMPGAAEGDDQTRTNANQNSTAAEGQNPLASLIAGMAPPLGQNSITSEDPVPQGAQNPFQAASSMLMQNPQMMQQMLGSMGGDNPMAALQAAMGGASNPAPPDDRAPEDRYAEQLRQLNDMGFYEFERNIEALRRTGGSVQGAVEYLLTH